MHKRKVASIAIVGFGFVLTVSTSWWWWASWRHLQLEGQPASLPSLSTEGLALLNVSPPAEDLASFSQGWASQGVKHARCVCPALDQQREFWLALKEFAWPLFVVASIVVTSSACLWFCGAQRCKCWDAPDPNSIDPVNGWVCVQSPVTEVDPEILQTSKTWYRLADIIKSKKWRENALRYVDLGSIPNSIAAQYLMRTSDEMNISVILDIVEERSVEIEKPPANSVVIHVRVGDFLPSGVGVFKLVSEGACRGDPWGARNGKRVASASQISDSIQVADVQKVVLLAGLHNAANKLLSALYLEGVQEHLRALGYEVELRLGRDPDEDVVYVSSARFFKMAGGGYSELLARLVEAKGGTVIPAFEWEAP